MERRELLGVLGAGAVGLTVAGVEASAQEGRQGARRGDSRDGYNIMEECARVCNETASACLTKLCEGGSDKGRSSLAKAHAAMIDCQAFCHLTAALMSRKSAMAGYAHRACADACRDCAEACEEVGGEELKQCAEVCRRCEKHCREHAGHAAASR